MNTGIAFNSECHSGAMVARMPLNPWSQTTAVSEVVAYRLVCDHRLNDQPTVKKATQGPTMISPLRPHNQCVIAPELALMISEQKTHVDCVVVGDAVDLERIITLLDG